MAAQSSPQAVLLDALGTLMSFEPPAPHLRAALLERLEVDVGAAAAAAAIRAEIAYYRAHLHEGSDPAALADLRLRCAEAMRPALPGLEAPADLLLDALMASLRFFAYPDSAPALEALRAAGVRTVVVSNWDWSLHERLAETGLADLVDGALASAEVGSAKPDGGIFRSALELAGVAARDAWHVGDTPEADVAGARAAGLRPVLIVREGPLPSVPGAAVVRSLAELLPLAVPR
jgi:putative hydrolase of the HAD superfamily